MEGVGDKSEAQAEDGCCLGLNLRDQRWMGMMNGTDANPCLIWLPAQRLCLTRQSETELLFHPVSAFIKHYFFYPAAPPVGLGSSNGWDSEFCFFFFFVNSAFDKHIGCALLPPGKST